jgi:putative oxidoreductase
MKSDAFDNETLQSLGLLLLRVGAGGMLMLGHGWGKLAHYSDMSVRFSDPLGVGSGLSLALALSAEFFGSLLVILGLATRFAALPVLFTMLMAALVIHADDPWSKKELALIYAVPFVTLIFTGPGRFSVDAWFRARKKN